MAKVLLYITKWVLARGIIRAEVDIKAGTPDGWVVRHHSDWHRLGHVRIGKDAFESLDDAKEDAKRRFETHLKKSKREVLFAQTALKQLDKLAIHTNLKAKISTLKVFE